MLAHGSRDAAWRAPFEAIAARISAQMALQQSELQVRCAYLQLCAPDLAQVAADLCQAGCQHIAIAPLFLGAGGHVRKDLPQLLDELASRHPGVSWRLCPAVGETDILIQALADLYRQVDQTNTARLILRDTSEAFRTLHGARCPIALIPVPTG